MKPTWKFNLLLLLIMAVPVIYLAWAWPTLPERVITHWGFDGQPDQYGSKRSLIALLAVGVLFPNALLWVAPRLDPKNKISSTQASFSKIQLVLSLFLSALALLIIHASAQQQFDITVWLGVLIGLMIAGLGNYLANVRPNYFVGIRTPWTLENETVWRKTHQFGSRVLFWSGLAMAGASLVLPDPWKFRIVLLVLPVMLLPVVYSYRVFQQEKRND